jgi:hypothetical protein
MCDPLRRTREGLGRRDDPVEVVVRTRECERVRTEHHEEDHEGDRRQMLEQLRLVRVPDDAGGDGDEHVQ